MIIIAPVIMNGLAFWFQDNFLKKKETPAGEEETEGGAEKEKEGTSTASERGEVRELLL